jgi:N-dimethylarginine dimethylaminohydrolase
MINPATAERFLMCSPEHFEVSYVINPWMAGNVVDSALATQQWTALATLLGAVATVEHINGAAGIPDMVFTANAGVVLGTACVLSRFRVAERQGEEVHFERWFTSHGFNVLTLPRDLHFEGAGDAVLDRYQSLLWLGYGHRSDPACAPIIADWLGIETQPLRLVNDRFYHLDTCFCPLAGGYLLYYPAAFDIVSQAVIESRVPVGRRIVVTDVDAFAFACNAVNCGRHLFLNKASPTLVDQLHGHGFEVTQTPLTEYLKSGGSAKCLTLKVTETSNERAALRAGGSRA